MTDPDLTRLLARSDQLRAALRDLVAATRRHLPECGCPEPGACPGERVVLSIRHHIVDMEALLWIALVQLAQLPAQGEEREEE